MLGITRRSLMGLLPFTFLRSHLPRMPFAYLVRYKRKRFGFVYNCETLLTKDFSLGKTSTNLDDVLQNYLSWLKSDQPDFSLNIDVVKLYRD